MDCDTRISPFIFVLEVYLSINVISVFEDTEIIYKVNYLIECNLCFAELQIKEFNRKQSL